MHILAVEKDVSCLAYLTAQLSRLLPDAEVAGFTDAAQALEYGAAFPPDALFTEAHLDDMTGFELAAVLKGQNSRLLVTIVADQAEYALDAWRIHAHYFIQKPYGANEVVNALTHTLNRM